MRFDNTRDAQSRLNDTIVMHDGHAMYVHGIDDEIRLVGEYISTEERVIVSQDDPLLSMSCPSLGYVNAQGNAFYFMRQPMRRWKQGIDLRSLVCPTEGMRARGILNNKAIADCLEGNYPPLGNALKRFESLNPFKSGKTTTGVAVSKHFALKRGDRGPLLCFKGQEVGVVEGGTPILSTKFHWLTELMESEL